MVLFSSTTAADADVTYAEIQLKPMTDTKRKQHSG